MLALGEFPAHALCLGGLGGFCGPVFVRELAGYGSGHAVEAVFRVDHHVLAAVGGELPGLLTELGSDQGEWHEGLAVELYKLRWPGPGSNRRPSAFQADAHTD